VCVVHDNVRSDISMQATLAEKQQRPSSGTITSRAEAESAQWITAAAAANKIGVAVEFIYDACATNGLKPVRLLGRRGIRIRPEGLDEWMSQFVVENR
jgi:excisionase family DNA binding protein